MNGNLMDRVGNDDRREAIYSQNCGIVSKRRPAPNMSETDPRPPSQLDSYVQKAKAPEPVLTPTTPTPTPATPSTAVEASPEAEPETAVDGAAELEEEAGQQGAFNPETGEINWDCPCLGGMAHGPCGEQFKAAFSCFIFSEAEPKGADCIEHFKKMQECFQEVSSGGERVEEEGNGG